MAEIALIALGLSMDAFAVAICTGLTMRKLTGRKMLIVGLYFGIFQAAMPLIGYLVGSLFADAIEAVDHWIAFVLLALIGLNMVKESFGRSQDESSQELSLGPRRMLPLAVATSIDALAVGVSFAFLRVEIVSAVTVIGLLTLVMSALGVWLGHVFGSRFKRWAELGGGVLLILLGLKILLEHLEVL